MSGVGPPFAKMSGAGNDFIVLEAEQADVLGPDTSTWVPSICRRAISVGADGVLLVGPVGTGRIRVSFFNPDGSEAFCGNGSRCAARFAHLRGMADRSMTLETRAGEVPARVEGGRVELSLPPVGQPVRHRLQVAGSAVEGHYVDAGTPHLVVFVDDPRTAALERWGPALRRDSRFAPVGVNVDLVALGDDLLRLRTWEKGVERETLSCGSGAVAAAAVARTASGRDRFRILPASGIPLEVAFEGDGVRMTGDARLIFQARLGAEALEAVP